MEFLVARISGVNVPSEKNLFIALTYVKGIGRTTAMKICKECGLDPNVRVKNLSEAQISDIRAYIDANLTVEGSLVALVTRNIKHMIEIGCYRGLRHRKGLPVRGQNTRTNARMRKGKRKIVANKKK